ncbi:non-hydrolyzing UDP-N-acetylglucosamine 2-epimerase [Roseomonas sp. AR75]|uniref:non-hydrolyzing UDP-N-acetylglucosamine 2-epimerase n=1 Tax=Roseomonas sp. AR75 TaxID=2562311 RepID=UPI001F118CB6|nr:UDP-N-acetylglucosamine 2-epimerase (non-hydrolyzing) [Roseomonas sp. AR75]
MSLQSGCAGLRVMLVLGTRPEAIKMLPVLDALRARPGFAPFLLSTGQHREMLDQTLAAFGAAADQDLGVMTPGQPPALLFSRILLGVTEVLGREKPDLVLVHGDTTTAMAAALAAFYARVPIGHVEAGMRSCDLARPFPEELNRVVVDAMATLRFAPTEAAAANLRREYGARGHVLVTGNTGIDALMGMAMRLATDRALSARVEAMLPPLDPVRRLLVVTAHRRESFGRGLDALCDALARIAVRGDVEIVWPLHRNPAARGAALRRLRSVPGIHLVEPLDYAGMVWLMCRATLLLTDSGGLQEEGPALGKPVLVLRDVTERPEAVATGVAKLVGTDPRAIRGEVARLLDDGVAYAAMARHVFPYGDGTAAARIVDAIAAWAGSHRVTAARSAA